MEIVEIVQVDINRPKHQMVKSWRHQRKMTRGEDGNK